MPLSVVIAGLLPAIHRAACSKVSWSTDMPTYFVDMLACRPYGTLYIGVTKAFLVDIPALNLCF